MNSAERKKFIRDFLEKMHNKNLCNEVNSKLLNDEYVRKFPLTLVASGDVLHSIIDHYEDGKSALGVSRQDMGIFVLFFEINFVNSSLEYIKKMLMMLIPKSITNSQNFFTYGTLLSLISDKLGDGEEYKKIVFATFFLNLRNAISHVDYHIEENKITIKIDGKNEIFDMVSFTNIVNEVKSIMDTILEFVNNKTQELDKQSKDLEKKATELKHKAALIDQATRAKRLETSKMKQKTSKISNEINRLSRKNEKINKKSEILDRKKSKNKVRVISKSEERSSLYDDIE